jgi:chondroitin 4-sulfotransferase 11
VINDKHKVIFIHVIKTGGISIATALDMKVKQCHLSATKIKKKVGGDVWNDYFKFSFVRNPFDKIISQYHYNRGKFGFEDCTFKEYVRAWSKGVKISSCPQFNSYYINEPLDFIGRFENLQHDFNIVCDKIGISQKQLPHKNKSKHKHYTEYYDDETRQIVAEKFAKDIEYFRYKFGE